VSTEKILEAAHRTANKLGFDDGEQAFWQCNLFSNAIIKTARNHKIYSLSLIVVIAEWQTDSGDVKYGDMHHHCFLKYADTYIDFTIRQIDSNQDYPYISKDFPEYFTFHSRMSFDYSLTDNSDLDNYVKEIEKELKKPSKIKGTFKISK
jgi:hypothetical protein